jgi:membrane associated rhomboid family serine protease
MNRQSPFANLTPVVKNLLIINLIFFLAFLLFDRLDARGPVTTLFASFYFDSPNFKPWQFLTYMFMHGGFQHILFNMFALFSFGPILEYFMGSKRFFNLYIICGLGAGILQMAVQAVEVHNLAGTFTIGSPKIDASYYLAAGAHAQQLYDIYHGPLVGASGAVYGLLVAFALIYPNLELMILFLPIPIKAKYLVAVFIVIELVSGFGQFAGDNVAHFAHLGGALIGFILVKAWGLKGPESY